MKLHLGAGTLDLPDSLNRGWWCCSPFSQQPGHSSRLNRTQVQFPYLLEMVMTCQSLAWLWHSCVVFLGGGSSSPFCWCCSLHGMLTYHLARRGGRWTCVLRLAGRTLIPKVEHLTSSKKFKYKHKKWNSAKKTNWLTASFASGCWGLADKELPSYGSWKEDYCTPFSSTVGEEIGWRKLLLLPPCDFCLICFS